MKKIILFCFFFYAISLIFYNKSFAKFECYNGSCYNVSEAKLSTNNYQSSFTKRENTSNNNSSEIPGSFILIIVFIIAFAILHILLKNERTAHSKLIKQKAESRRIYKEVLEKCQFYSKSRKKSNVVALYRKLNSFIEQLENELEEIEKTSKLLREYSGNIIKSKLGMPENLMFGGFAMKQFNRYDKEFDYVKGAVLRQIKGENSVLVLLKDLYQEVEIMNNIPDTEKEEFEILKSYIIEKIMQYLETICYHLQVNTQTYKNEAWTKGYNASHVIKTIENDTELNSNTIYNFSGEQIKQFDTRAHITYICTTTYKIPVCVFYTYKFFDEGAKLFNSFTDIGDMGRDIKA